MNSQQKIYQTVQMITSVSSLVIIGHLVFVCCYFRSAHPEAEVVVAPGPAVLLHRAGSRYLVQVVVPADEHEWDGGVRLPQGLLQVPLLGFSEFGSWWVETAS